VSNFQHTLLTSTAYHEKFVIRLECREIYDSTRIWRNSFFDLYLGSCHTQIKESCHTLSAYFDRISREVRDSTRIQRNSWFDSNIERHFVTRLISRTMSHTCKLVMSHTYAAHLDRISREIRDSTRMCDSFHWKCYPPQIHQIQKHKLFSTNSNEIKISIWICTVRYREIWVSRFGGFWGCSNFSGNCHREIRDSTQI